MFDLGADGASDLLIYSLLFVALVIGWFLGKLERRNERIAPAAPISREYFQGINLLLNDKRDEAVDVLLKTLEVNNESVDTYLVMGSLFRQRGEVERAIRTHQDLLARPSLGRDQQSGVRLELARDYLKAGLLDRAERLLKELVEENGAHTKTSLALLLGIFEQQKEWQSAVDVALALRSKGDDALSVAIAHYYCELAEQAKKVGDTAEARGCLRKALDLDKKCVRARLLEAGLEEKSGNSVAAIKAYQLSIRQDPRYLTEALAPLERCYQVTGNDREYLKYLFECLDVHPSASLVIALSKSVARLEGVKAAVFVLMEYLKKRPSVKVLDVLIDYQVRELEYREPQPSGADRNSSSEYARGPSADLEIAPSMFEHLRVLKEFTSRVVERRSLYRCEHCGYEGRSLYWRCPACHRWGTIAPIQGLDGE
ncbi:Predicted N-acetylglucosaminyl transferase [gamma proteobacterium HdN1]|nr:Predicted N-acetylglucosaminyl transferase [gamma proteobacterium HdN1]